MFKVFLARYKNLITLIWCVGVFLYYKIVHDFQFKNGSSLVFLTLILVLPLSLHLHYVIVRKRTKKLKKGHQASFFGQIQFDYHSKEMNYTLLNPLHLLNKTTKLEEIEDELKIITGDDTYATITFNNRLCKIEIENTEIVYNLYYDRVVFDTSDYDQKGFKYYTTENLYKAILSIIKNLKRERLFYQETRQGDKILVLKLFDRETEEILYEKKLRRRSLFGGEISLYEKKIII